MSYVLWHEEMDYNRKLQSCHHGPDASCWDMSNAKYLNLIQKKSWLSTKIIAIKLK